MGKLCRKKGSETMKQALKLINEIKADYKAINNSKSKYLINDKLKHIKRLKRELREYCSYENINYNELIKRVYN